MAASSPASEVTGALVGRSVPILIGAPFAGLPVPLAGWDFPPELFPPEPLEEQAAALTTTRPAANNEPAFLLSSILDPSVQKSVSSSNRSTQERHDLTPRYLLRANARGGQGRVSTETSKESGRMLEQLEARRAVGNRGPVLI
jgi:hypothetical protein